MSEIDVLILRLEAPLMSFGGVRVDERNPTEEAPGTSLLAGLCGNALGYRHGDHEHLERLQSRIRHASRRDRPGRRLVDFHTVDLSQDFLQEAWTTHGAPAGRAGGTAKTGTHIRYRHFIADAAVTVAMTLRPPDEEPNLERLARALEAPARPLFIGRKCCLPSVPLVVERRRAGSLRQALEEAPLAPDGLSARAPIWNPAEPSPDGSLPAWWPGDEPPPQGEQVTRFPVVDERDWLNQVHVGRRLVWQGPIRARGFADE
jgi:CRISPR system Cascade subunit CasD